MQPQRKHEEIQPDIRPKLGVIQGGGEASDPYRGHLAVAPESNDIKQAETTAAGRGGLSAIQGGGEKSEPRRGHLKAVDSAADLNKQEATTADDNSMNFHKEDKKKKRVKANRWWNKKRAGVAGAISGVVVGGALIGGPAAIGPLEFIHLAHRLHDAHFSQQENAGDGRMGKLYRYLSSGGRAGETRIGWISSKYHARIIGKLADIGIVPQYGTLDTYKGFTVDTEHENSPYKGMTPEEAAQEFERKTGIKPQVVDGKLQVDADKFWAQRKSLNAMLGELGDSKVTTAVRVRKFARFGWVTWHPLEIADKWASAKAVDFAKYMKDKWDTRFKNGDKLGVTVDTSKAKEQGTDKNGNPANTDLDPEAAAAAEKAPENAKEILSNKSTLESLKNSTSLKVTGVVAGVAGAVCVLKAVDDGIADVRYEQVIKPAMRVGMNAMSTGYQTEGGVGSTGKELGYLHGYFNSRDANGNSTGNWSDAASLRAQAGQEGGKDLPPELKELMKDGKPAWLDWTQGNPAIDGLCSTGGMIATGALSVTIGVLSGGVVSTIAGALLGAALTGPVIEKASATLAGDALDVSMEALRGETYGSIADVGTFYGSKAASAQFGGVPMTLKQSMELKAVADQQNREDFAQQSFLARTFNPKDYRSLVGSAIDDSGIGGGINLTNTTQNIATLVRSAAKVPASIFTSTVHADDPIPYDYGYQPTGFSLEDLNNPAVQNPYENAEEVTKLLDGPNGSDYISKASDCFGVTIGKESTGDGGQVWGVVTTKDVNFYDTEKYSQLGCADSSLEWLRIRFFIFDTGIIEGYACVQLDDGQSCTNSGTGSGNPNDASSSTGGTATASDNVDYNACKAVATGNGKIVCSAYLFDHLAYSQAGPHGDWNFLNCVKSNFAGDCASKYPAGSEARKVDCSALVTYAIYDAMGWDVKAYDTKSMGASPWFKQISDEDAQPGDILLTPGTHTEVIVSNDKVNKKFLTFGAHEPKPNPEDDVSPSGYAYGKMQAYRVVQP